jgi:hypothetical protein
MFSGHTASIHVTLTRGTDHRISTSTPPVQLRALRSGEVLHAAIEEQERHNRFVAYGGQVYNCFFILPRLTKLEGTKSIFRSLEWPNYGRN